MDSSASGKVSNSLPQILLELFPASNAGCSGAVPNEAGGVYPIKPHPVTRINRIGEFPNHSFVVLYAHRQRCPPPPDDQSHLPGPPGWASKSEKPGGRSPSGASPGSAAVTACLPATSLRFLRESCRRE